MPRRTVSDNSGAELRAWLLAEEQGLYDAMMAPPHPPLDGRLPTVVSPAFLDLMGEELSKPLRALADGKAHRLRRSDLPPDHPARRAGALSDYLILTETNELVIDD